MTTAEWVIGLSPARSGTGVLFQHRGLLALDHGEVDLVAVSTCGDIFDQAVLLGAVGQLHLMCSFEHL